MHGEGVRRLGPTRPALRNYGRNAPIRFAFILSRMPPKNAMYTFHKAFRGSPKYSEVVPSQVRSICDPISPPTHENDAMALPEGQRLDSNTPTDSRPQHGPVPVDAPAPRQGKGYDARTAPDGTRWCAHCDWTLDPNRRTRICGRCKSRRDSTRHRFDKRSVVVVPHDVLELIVAAIRQASEDVDRISARLAVRKPPLIADLRNLSLALATMRGAARMTRDTTHGPPRPKC